MAPFRLQTRTWIMLGNGLLLGVFLAILFILFWGAERGFNLTDEGYYYLSYQHPERYPISLNSVPFMMGRLFSLADGDIFRLRMVRVLLLFAGILYFSLEFLAFLRTCRDMPSKPLRFLMAMFLMVGGMSACFLGPQTISYNHLTQFLLLVAMGIIFRLHVQPASEKFSWIPFFGMGIAAGYLFLVKWPVSVLVFGIAGIIMAGLREPLRISKAFGAIFLGVFAALGSFFLLFQPLPDWLHHFSASNRMMMRNGTHEPGLLMSTYLHDLGWMAASPILNFGRELFSLVVLGILHGVLSQREGRSLNSRILKLARILWWVAIGVVGYFLMHRIFDRLLLENIRTGLYAYWVVLLLMALSVFSCALLANKRQENGKFWLAAILLLILPFVGAFGTTNPIGYNAYYGLIFWFGLLLLLSLHARRCRLPPAIPMACGLFFILFVLVQIRAYFYDGSRYLYASSLLYQRHAARQFPPLRNIKLDSNTLGFLEAVHKTLRQAGYRKGDTLIPLYDLPGLVYLLEGVSPGNAWYNSYPKSVEENCAGLALAGEKALKGAYFLVNKKIERPMRACLQRYGLKPGQTHLLVGKIPFIFASFYNAGYYTDSLEIYAPAVRIQPGNPVPGSAGRS